MSALPLDGRCPACGYMHLVADADGVITCTWQDCPTPTLVAELLSKPDQHVHLVKFDERGYTVQHPLVERVRVEGLFACDLADEFGALREAPGIGMYRIPIGGSLIDMEEVDEADVLFEVPQAPQSPEVDAEEARQSIADVVPLGSISGFSPDTPAPSGWMHLLSSRQAIPDDCTELLTYIETGNDWPFFLDDGSPAVPSLDDVNGTSVNGQNAGASLVIRVR